MVPMRWSSHSILSGIQHLLINRQIKIKRKWVFKCCQRLVLEESLCLLMIPIQQNKATLGNWLVAGRLHNPRVAFRTHPYQFSYRQGLWGFPEQESLTPGGWGPWELKTCTFVLSQMALVSQRTISLPAHSGISILPWGVAVCLPLQRSYAGQILCRYFLNCGTVFPNDSSLHQIDMKLAGKILYWFLRKQSN